MNLNLKISSGILAILVCLLISPALHAQPAQYQDPTYNPDPNYVNQPGSGNPEPLGGCGAGEVFTPDGGQYCEWLGVGQMSAPTWVFICMPTGDCLSACYPNICASFKKPQKLPAVVSASASRQPSASRIRISISKN